MRTTLFLLFAPFLLFSQGNLFDQMYDLLPTANNYRTATGAPGHEYYQQQADYIINVELNDLNQSISGEETITFYNNSPDVLTFLWLQLDQNIRSLESDKHKINPQTLSESTSEERIEDLNPTFDGGFKLAHVKDMNNQNLKYIVNNTMMRLDLPTQMKKGDKFSFKIKYSYNIQDRMRLGGRSGYEYFTEDDNYLYTIAQFFPRMCAYNDVEGWQNKQFLGSGEFTLIFGNYDVNITVPSDHLVAATGTLSNIDKVLTKTQLERYRKAESEYVQPVIIATQEEAIKREETKATSKKTWSFKAKNVRDFAFASSRKFIWDAMNVKIGDHTSMAMSMYPKEGNPLWEKYSTKAVAHTIKTYSKFTIDYDYPVAWSINADKIGMEYPMICFNFGRCEKDGTYTERTKYGMISVIIHEVGHNFFPMIINNDERQWAWMDEGLNTFVQYLTEQEFQRDYPSRRGEASKIVPYMAGDKSKISPIMTNPESVFQLGNNAYAKPATALNILRETIMGRELFDYAFKEYARRWAYKQPYPADFFRTMEDASGVDLDWFWRGWFFTTDHVDLAISDIQLKTVKDGNNTAKAPKPVNKETLSEIRNKKDISKTYIELDPTLNDFYTETKAAQDKQKEDQSNQSMTSQNETSNPQDYYYEISFQRIGGLPMPIIYEVQYEDGRSEVIRIPAEAWRKGETSFSRVQVSKQKITQVILDPYSETADIDTDNNYFPRVEQENKFEIFKARQMQNEPNPMQQAKQKLIKP